MRCILFPFLCLFFVGCSLMPNELKTAESLIETNPDSALTILQKMSPDKYGTESTRALYGLLVFRALDKNLLPLKPDSLIDFSLNYYQRHFDYNHLAYCYLFKGRAYKYNFENEKAIGCYLKALDIAQNKKDNLLLGRINSDMGDIYNSQRDYILARNRFKQAYNYFTKANYPEFAFYSLLDIGITHYSTKEFNSAQIYFHRVYNQAKDSVTKGAALQEIGLCYDNAKQYDLALVYLRKVIYYPYTQNNRAIRYYYLADLYSDLEKDDSAKFFAQKALKYSPEIRTQRECYRILVNSESEKGNIAALTEYMKKYQDCTDSIRKIDAQTKGSILESIHLTTNEVQKSKQRFWYLLGLILLGTSIVIFLFIRIKIRNKKVINDTEKEYNKQKVNIQKSVMLNHRDALLHKISETKKNQSVERKKASLEKKEIMDRKLYEELLHLNDLDFFYREMDTVLNKLVTKLKKRYTGLTQKEICWCCLYLLEIPTTDILLILNYKVDSLNKMKQRLAQKINLSGVSKLNAFLENILSE